MFLLHCIVLELNCTVWYCKVLRGTLRYSTVFNCASTVLYFTVLYCTVLYCTVLYCTVLYCTVLYLCSLQCTVHNVLYNVYCKVQPHVLYIVPCTVLPTCYLCTVLFNYFVFCICTVTLYYLMFSVLFSWYKFSTFMAEFILDSMPLNSEIFVSTFKIKIRFDCYHRFKFDQVINISDQYKA